MEQSRSLWGTFTATLVSTPIFGSLPSGQDFATCAVRTSGPICDGAFAENRFWPVVVHRAPAIRLLSAAYPGDHLEICALVQDARVMVPRNWGWVDVLLNP